jgi:hypothetical protein
VVRPNTHGVSHLVWGRKGVRQQGDSLFRLLPVWSTLVATAQWKGPSTSAGSASLMSHVCMHTDVYGKHPLATLHFASLPAKGF